MARRVKLVPIVALVSVIVGVFALRYAVVNGYLSPAESGSASVPQVAALPEVQEDKPVAAAVPQLPLPSKTVVSVPGPEVRHLGMAWNAQLSLALAIGGPKTTQGSLMEKHGVNAVFVREDDVGKMGTQLIAFAKSMKGGNPQPTDGANFMAVMGDGSAATIAGIAGDLAKLGSDYAPEVVGSSGYSRGEDKLMGPSAWKANPKLMKGCRVSGFLRDGDWNIGVNFAANNSVKNNPDEHTWDPDAVNWYSADDFLKASEAYINGVCENLPVVRNGKRTGEFTDDLNKADGGHRGCVDSVVTWTPGDVNIAKGKGGLVSIASTKQYRSQMPQTIIGIKKWDEANRKTVDAFLAAMYEAGDQVKTYPAALTRGAEAEAEIYKDQDAAYWEKYFKGTVEADKTGVMVDLGGSSPNNLQDALRLYGLVPGKPNLFAATYTTFGDLVKSQYPKLVPSYPPVESVLNTSYTEDVAKASQASAAPAGTADAPTFVANSEIKDKFTSGKWPINFETGKATFTPDSMAQLQAMKRGLSIADDMLVEIQGHTDNTGDSVRNEALSQSRADAVVAWLVSQGLDRDRFKSKGFGDSVPEATNDTETGRAKNRRVIVITGH